MNDVLSNIVRFVAVPAAGIAVLPHGLNVKGVAKKPDIIGRSNGNFAIIGSTSTTVTVQNNSAVPASCDVWCWYMYSATRVFSPITAVEMTPSPFILAASGSGGGTAGPGDSQCLVFKPGSASAGPGTFNTWPALMAQLAAYRAQANGGGCYTIQFDDSIVSPCVIPAGAPYPMEDVTWAGDTTNYGTFVQIANGASFTGLRTFTNNLSIENRNTVTSPVADLVDGDIVRISEFTNLETMVGGVPFFNGAGIVAGQSPFVIMTESSTLGFYVTGSVCHMPNAGSTLVILCDDMRSAPMPGSLTSGVGAILSLSTASLANLPTVFPGWAGTILAPFIDAAPSLQPKPYLTAPSTVAFGADFSQWLRLNAFGGAIVQTLPSINAAPMTFRHPGCFLLVSEIGGGQDLTIVPAAGDTFSSGAASFQVPAQGSLLLISDGVSKWTIAADRANQRFSPPEQWAQQNVAASQTNVALSAQVSTNFDTIKMIRGGSIVGLVTRLTEAITAGMLTVTVTINGVAGTLALVHTNALNMSGGQTTQRAGIDTFAAGALIGIQLTTTAGFLPITTDLESWLEIEEVP